MYFLICVPHSETKTYLESLGKEISTKYPISLVYYMATNVYNICAVFIS